MIIVLMGVAGAGKSTIGRVLAKELDWPFYDADDFHPLSNREKIKQGTALTDEDRTVWLQAISEFIGVMANRSRSCVIACSALKQAYREKLAEKAPGVRFVYLKGEYDLIYGRLKARPGHFMKAVLLKSQFDILEEPTEAVVIDIAEEPPRIVKRIRQALGE